MCMSSAGRIAVSGDPINLKRREREEANEVREG